MDKDRHEPGGAAAVRARETDGGASGRELDRFMDDWAGGLARRGFEVASELRIAQRELDAVWRRADEVEPGAAPDGASASLQESCRRLLPSKIALVAQLRARMARVGTALASVAKGGWVPLLPIGTRVSFGDTCPGKGSYKAMPVPGSVGVVVGYSPGSEWPLRVVLSRDTGKGNGEVEAFDAARPWTILCAADELVAEAPGELVGAGLNEELGFVPTHRGRAAGDQPEMLVEADGRVWRIAEVGGWPQCLGVGEDAAEFAWLEPIQEAPVGVPRADAGPGAAGR